MSRTLVALALAPASLHADVLIVDAAGGGDFTTLSAAVAAASDGDTLLVRHGDYVEAAPIVIDGKSLSVLGEPALPFQVPGVVIRPGLIVKNLSASKVVLLENLLVAGNPGGVAAATTALVLQDNAGHVRVQVSHFVGGHGASNANPHGATGVRAIQAGSVDFLRCRIDGGEGQYSPNLGVKTGNGGVGLELSGGTIHLAESFVDGGFGGANEVGGWPDGGDGGNGVSHSSGTLLLTGSSLHGGNGGDAHVGGDGGDGLVLGASGLAWFMGESVPGGGSGAGGDSGDDGEDGEDLVDPFSLATQWFGDRRSFGVTSPLREGQNGTLDLGGDKSELTLLFVSLGIGQVAMPGHQGVFVASPAALLGPIVLASPAYLDLPFVAPTLPAALDLVRVHLQPVYVGGMGALLGPGAMLTLLDASL